MRLGLGFLGTPAIPEMVRLARRAERAGFTSVWVAETQCRRDAVSAAAALLAGTTSVRVGTGLVNVYTRAPVLLAMTAATLAEAGGGRFLLGLGTGSEEVLAAQGIAYHRPHTRLRETVEVLRRLLSGDAVHYRGETLRVDEARLEVVPPHPPALVLGVTGPRGLALAGQAADGVLLDVFTSPAYVSQAVATVRAAAARAGRPSGAVAIAGLLMTICRADGAEARAAARVALAGYLTLFPTIAAASGLPADRIADLTRRTRTDGPVAGAALVGDEVVEQLCAAGTPAECRRAVGRWREAGLEEPVLVTPDEVDRLIETFADAQAP